MEYSNNTFIWSDNWWIEDNKAWFVDGMNNILFCLDLDTHMCELAIKIPDENSSTFRLTPICIKCGKDILCIPAKGKSIWVFNLDNCKFTEIVIDGLDNFQWAFDFWLYKDKVFAIARLTNKILEVNISQRKIDNYHIICENDLIAASVRVDDSIYSVSEQSGKLYRFDLLTYNVETYFISGIEKKLAAICFDGKQFWLSGYSKEIYRWNKEENCITKLDEFPENFGVYNFRGNSDDVIDYETVEYEYPAFLNLVAVDEYIWCIPFETNKIIYVDKQTNEMKVLEIDDGVETKESILNIYHHCPGHKYLLEYVRDNRYLGVFSLEHDRVLEIDAKKLTYEWHDYYIGDRCMRQCAEIKMNTFFEYNLLDRKVYNTILQTNKCNISDVHKSCFGAKIYEELSTNIAE